MIMYGQMKKYKESLKTMQGPYKPNDFKQHVDIKGIMKYAEKKGVKVVDLTDNEKKAFLK